MNVQSTFVRGALNAQEISLLNEFLDW